MTGEPRGLPEDGATPSPSGAVGSGRRWQNALTSVAPRGLLAVMIVCAVAPAAVGLAWVVSRAASPLEQDAAAEPVIVAVGQAIRDRATPVAVELALAEPRRVEAAGSGVLTELRVEPGDRVESGAVVVAVDDQPWLAFAAPAPLWRDLRLGMSGDDVERVQDFLAELGLSTGSVRGTVTQATVSGFRALNERLGLGRSEVTLHRSTLLWIGPGPLTVGEVLAQPGDIVAPGTPLLTGPAEPAKITVTEPEARLPDGEYVLVVGDTAVPYQLGSGAVSEPADVAALAEALGNRESGSGTLRLAEPAQVGTLPASAVITDANGRTCIFESVDGPPISVEPIGGSLSVVDVPVDWVGRTVLANPRQVRAELSCG